MSHGLDPDVTLGLVALHTFFSFVCLGLCIWEMGGGVIRVPSQFRMLWGIKCLGSVPDSISVGR